MNSTVFKINKLDAEIIKEMLYEGRIGFAEIAQACGVTKNRIWKRYNILEQKGIINGATLQTNFAQFGYEGIATLLISVEAQQIETLIAHMKKIPEVIAFRQYNSIYNVRGFASLKDLKELDRVKQTIKRKLPNMDLRTYIWTDIRNIPENLSLTSNSNEPSTINKEYLAPIIQEQSELGKIDDLDSQIIEKLLANGRASFTQIAKEIGTSTDTIMKRYHKLHTCRAIKPLIQINPKKLGYNTILDFSISFASKENPTENVVDSLTKIPDVIIITKTSGDYDLQVTAMIKDIDHSFSIQDQIAATCNVTKMDVSARKIPEKWPTPKQNISTF